MVAALLLASATTTAQAQLSAENKKEIAAVSKELQTVNSHVKKKAYDEAEKILKESQEKLADIAKDANLKPSDKAFAQVGKTLTTARAALLKARGVSFVKDVAPIIIDKCLECHSQEGPKGGLRLDTFESWEKHKDKNGGSLLIPKNAGDSLIVARINPQQPAETRMPKGQDATPLTAAECEMIMMWINQGAKFDGAAKDKDRALNKLQSEGTDAKGKKGANAAKAPPEVVIAQATGKETVSFTKDIAPWMAQLCGRCHSGNTPRGGLSLVSYYDMLKGGESGAVVLPGKPKEESRLFRLTGGLDNPRMPNDQARLTRTNYDALVKWFDEGCTLDGKDPKTPLRTYVRSDAELAAEKLGKMSADDMLAMRRKKADDEFKKALPRDEKQLVESDNFLILGNVPPDRLSQVQSWAEEHAKTLKKFFGAGETPLWRGKLAVFVLKDRFSYDEFSQSVDGRRAEKEMIGHSKVTIGDGEAYVAVQDLGDSADQTNPGLRVNVIDHITGAYLKRNGAKMPDWVARGAGLALASKEEGGNRFISTLRGAAGEALSGLRPTEVFSENALSPLTVGPIGLVAVEQLLANGGPGKFAKFVVALQQGRGTDAALKDIYSVNPDDFAKACLGAARKKR